MNDYLNIKIYKYQHYDDATIFFFFKNDYVLCHISEYKKDFIFTEFYNENKIKNMSNHINNFNHYMQKIELYEFLFSDDINRLFFNRTKPTTYYGNMQKALKLDKELTEYFQNIIENE